jgi:outer membrane protein OmpA-like peptidoglycan-associated protein
MVRNILTVVLVLCMVGPSHAGWFEDALKSAVEGLGRRAVDEATTGTYEGVKKEAKDAINKKDPAPENAPGVKGSGGSGTAAAKQPSTEAQPSGSAEATIENAESVYSKYDFIPGGKVIFFDDFSDTDVGEFPRKWHLSGPKSGNNNAVEVAEYQGKRFLRSSPAGKNQRQFESTQFIRLNQKGDLPEKFTVEFDAVFANAIPGGYPSSYYLLLLNSKDGWLQNHPANLGVTKLSGEENISKNTKTAISQVDGKLHHVAVSVNGTFLKAYIDNVRVINDPDGVKRPITMVGLSMASDGTLPSDKVMFTNFRLAEGGKSIKSALETDGKIITHGILFDTGKDIIRPESLPTLKSILAILSDDPGLNFSIEGHTDNQGNKAINQPLSEKRAAAVRTWMIDKGIAAARLKTRGFGDTKPLDSNTTTEGRANNRRVEFVKF